MTSPRRSKPTLERHEPIRTFNGVFGHASPSSRVGPPPGVPEDSVSRGVDAGYRVIEEYMRQGQSFARAVWPQGAASGAPGTADPQKLMERMFQYASDLATVWLEYAQMTMGQVPFAPPVPAQRPSPEKTQVGAFDIEEPASHVSTRRTDARPDANGAGGSRFEAERAPRVLVDVTTKRRVEVSVDARAGAAAAALVVHDLRANGASPARISGVTAAGDAGAERIVVKLAIEDELPPGTYVGLMVDEQNNLPQGTIAVRVFDTAS